MTDSVRDHGMIVRRPLSDPTSKAIYWLQGFLAVCIVAIHSGQDVPLDHPAILIVKFINYGVTLPTLQCYFLLAGFLMFQGFDKFGFAQYRYVISRRIVSLVLPWLIWAVVGYFAWVIFAPERTAPPFWRLDHIIWAKPSTQTLVVGHTEIPLLGTPFGCGVMYCIRDIFIAAILSPIIWWTVRALKMWTVAIMIIVYYLIVPPGIGPWHANWIFLPIGAALAVGHFDLQKFSRFLGWPIVALWVLLTAGVAWIVVNFDWHHIGHGIWTRLYMLTTVLIGMLAYLVLSFKGSSRRNSLMMMLVPFAFFIIAIHVLPMIEKPLLAASVFTSDTLGIPDAARPIMELFWLIPVRIVLIVGIATLLARISPRLMAVLTGNRFKYNKKINISPPQS